MEDPESGASVSLSCDLENLPACAYSRVHLYIVVKEMKLSCHPLRYSSISYMRAGEIRTAQLHIAEMMKSWKEQNHHSIQQSVNMTQHGHWSGVCKGHTGSATQAKLLIPSLNSPWHRKLPWG